MTNESVASHIARHLRRDALVAIGDGVGAPTGIGQALAEAAASVGGVRLLLGWCLAEPVPLDDPAFTDVRTIMGGYALRAPIGAGRVQYVPTRLSAVPALLASTLRPDVVIASLTPGESGPVFGTEVGWLPAAIETGATVLVELNHGLPAAAGKQGPATNCRVIAEVDRPPLELPTPPLDDTSLAIGKIVASLIPSGATLQLGPGWVGEAVAMAIERPVRVFSGVLPDAVVALEQRGLLLDEPRAAYIAGTESLYRWADGRDVLTRIENSHDANQLAAAGPFVAVNTALQIDEIGQVNVEGSASAPISGIGGHPDFAYAGTRSRDALSIIAMPTTKRDRPTLVARLDGPVSTPRCDVGIVVTEHGYVDLRSLSDAERGPALRSLWQLD